MISISNLIKKWSCINKTDKIIIISDDIQKNIANAIKEEGIFDVQIEYFSKNEKFFSLMKSLKNNDLVIILLSVETYMKNGANEYFSPFKKPDWLISKYIFIRLDISKNSLLQGLSTDKKLVYDKIKEMNQYSIDKIITVKNKSGTDISFKIKPFTTCSHEIKKAEILLFFPRLKLQRKLSPILQTEKLSLT